MSDGAESWFARNHFLLRRLHSLSGVLPVGAFLIVHLFTNSLAWWPEKFNEHVHQLHETPYLLIVEVLFIFLPLAFHAGYGVVIALTGQLNVRHYGYADNWRYALQRITGWVALVFILAHLAHFRFAHWLGGPLYMGTADPFGQAQAGFGLLLPAAVWLVLYAAGLVASVYHFVNGLCTFCITWGITVGDRSRRYVSVAALGLGVVLLAWGFLSLAAMRVKQSPLAQPRGNYAQVACEVSSGPR